VLVRAGACVCVCVTSTPPPPPSLQTSWRDEPTACVAKHHLQTSIRRVPTCACCTHTASQWSAPGALVRLLRAHKEDGRVVGAHRFRQGGEGVCVCVIRIASLRSLVRPKLSATSGWRRWATRASRRCGVGACVLCVATLLPQLKAKSSSTTTSKKSKKSSSAGSAKAGEDVMMQVR
jgi:hypothetical protein